MKTTTVLAALLASLALVACSGDDSNATADSGTADAKGPGPDGGSGSDAQPGTDSGGSPDTGTDSGGSNTPPPPALGAQIDRMGRPAINTATNHTFDANDATKNAAKDGYNQESDPTKWSAHVAEMEKNLAILDSLDTTCGNQIFADMTKTDASRYGTLSTVLSDDRLWVKTDATTCTTYLAVEANATKVIVNSDCGGRMPAYDVMNITYSAVALGTLDQKLDGITAVPDRSKVAAFPYLAPPN